MEVAIVNEGQMAEGKGATRWALWAACVSVAGVLLSLYMVADKYRSSGRSSCDLSERISCSVINNSEFASLFGVPVAVLGIVWFLVIGFLSYRLHNHPNGSASTLSSASGTIYTNKGMSEAAALAMAMLAWCVAGAGFIVYLLVAEIILGAICPMCTAVHVLVAFLFYASLRLYARHAIPPHSRDASSPLSTFFASATSLPTLTSAARALQPLLPALAALAALPLVIFILATISLPALDPSHAALRTCVLTNRQQLVFYGTDTCAACRRQKEVLGPDLLQLVRYVDCVRTPSSCAGKELKGYPTWAVEDWSGQERARHYGLRTLSQLLSLAACDVASS